MEEQTIMQQTDDRNAEIDRKLRQFFDGRIVRKDLTKKIKEGANVPVYVLEFLLGQYCSSDDPEVVSEGVNTVKRILADNYVRPDEAQKILSMLRQRGSHTVIDKITVGLNMKKDTYEAEFSNLGIKNVPISEEYPAKFDRLLCGGIWCIVGLEYEFIEEDKNASPIHIRRLTPIQMPHVDIGELKEGRRQFTEDEWLSVMLRSCGYEPDTLSEREKWLLLTRMIPLVENNFNLCELGPRSTGKSHIYKEISPNSILVSGGQTTVANLFYNMGRKTVGLVGLWDCVAFDEVAGINFKDKDGSRISGAVSTTTKDYIVNYQDLQGLGMTEKLTLPTVIALCSIALGKPALSSLAVLGEISIAGSILKVDELANALQVCLDSGAKKVLLPITSAADLGTVPPELVGCFNLIFYQSPEDAVFKALGVE